MFSFDDKINSLNQKLSKISSPKTTQVSEPDHHQCYSELQVKTKQFAQGWEEKSLDLFRRIQNYQLYLLDMQRKIDEYYLRETQNYKEQIEIVKDRKSQQIEDIRRRLVKLKCWGQEQLQNRIRQIRKQNNQVFKGLYKKFKNLQKIENPQLSLTQNLTQNDTKILNQLLHNNSISKKLEQISINQKIKQEKLENISRKISTKINRIYSNCTSQIVRQSEAFRDQDIKMKRMLSLISDLL